jgi:hypothetical protein
MSLPNDFEDPEENNWVLPGAPNLASVPDNTSTWGPFYHWQGTPNPAQRRISVAVTREITSPWRRGLGITVRPSRREGSVAHAIGLWLTGHPPRIMAAAPREENWHDVVRRANDLSHLDNP